MMIEWIEGKYCAANYSDLDYLSFKNVKQSTVKKFNFKVLICCDIPKQNGKI